MASGEAAAYRLLPTEQANPASRRLDLLPLRSVVALLCRAEARVFRAAAAEAPRIARAAAAAADALAGGGALIFVGAGTSGRLGVLEAAEIPPTFGLAPGRVKAIMAGGRGAVFRSREGAEDDAADGARRLRRAARRGDMVVGVAASGVTPFVRGALTEARALGCRTALVTANSRVRVPAAQIVIAPRTGPELLAGSTRLKSGSAAKLVLNALTTAAMVRLGKVYDGWMVDFKPTNRKLVFRAARLIAALGRVDARRAETLLAESGRHVKTAVVMARLGLGRRAARRRLSTAAGSLRRALGEV
ncbi:MAG: N-acetylmuramic acid 6-phosphate etherase [Elusimicrobia bacterium]|nr:N-acetylmuramic acid 6-phosphate etherase [Elusimicrobiota bacterium]